MPKLFFTPGYNVPDLQTLLPLSLYINGVENQNFSEGIDEYDLTKSWTPNHPLNLIIYFDVDAAAIYASSNLSRKDRVLLSLHTYSSGTKLQHVGTFTEIHDGENIAQIEIPPGEIAETIVVFATLTVKLAIDQFRNGGAPVINLSRLVTKSWTFRLSGSQSQANVVLVDFSQKPRWKKSMWHVQTRKMPDLDSWLIAQQSNMLRVELNRDYSELMLQPQFQALLATDISIQALDDAIRNDEIFEFLLSESDGDGTWSIFVKTIFREIFPVRGVNVRQTWEQNQEEIRSIIQNLMTVSLGLS